MRRGRYDFRPLGPPSRVYQGRVLHVFDLLSSIAVAIEMKVATEPAPSARQKLFWPELELQLTQPMAPPSLAR